MIKIFIVIIMVVDDSWNDSSSIWCEGLGYNCDIWDLQSIYEENESIIKNKYKIK